MRKIYRHCYDCFDCKLDRAMNETKQQILSVNQRYQHLIQLKLDLQLQLQTVEDEMSKFED